LDIKITRNIQKLKEKHDEYKVQKQHEIQRINDIKETAKA